MLKNELHTTKVLLCAPRWPKIVLRSVQELMIPSYAFFGLSLALFLKMTLQQYNIECIVSLFPFTTVFTILLFTKKWLKVIPFQCSWYLSDPNKWLSFWFCWPHLDPKDLHHNVRLFFHRLLLRGPLLEQGGTIGYWSLLQSVQYSKKIQS